jgi:flagellin-like protein
MNFVRKMRKLQHNAKALSPVVASIILIAVTVAVSIAVAAWMGGLSTGFMQTEQLSITVVTANAGTGSAVISVSNTGTSPVTVSQVYIGTTQITGASLAFGGANMTAAGVISANGVGTITLSGQTFTSGSNYQFKIVTSKGTNFAYSAIAA